MPSICPRARRRGEGHCPGRYVSRVRLRILLAFAAIWFVWGSTYLAIAVAVREIPPLVVAATRNLTAGLLLYAWVRANGAPRPSRRQWGQATVVGILLLGIGNGAVTWSGRREPSGVVALMVSLVPLWLMVFGWVGQRGVRPQLVEVLGVATGLAGIALLVAPDGSAVAAVSLVGALVLLASTVAWSAGSLYARQLDAVPVPLAATGMEMIAGGAFLVAGSALAGEWRAFDAGGISWRGAVSLLYLIVFGSIIGFSSYKYLLGRVRPALIGTYAFVNPLVAVLLGWTFLGEAVTPRLLLAMGLIVGAVAMISLRPYFSRR